MAASHCQPADHSVRIKSYISQVATKTKGHKKHLDRMTKKLLTLNGSERSRFDLRGQISFLFNQAGFFTSIISDKGVGELVGIVKLEPSYLWLPFL